MNQNFVIQINDSTPLLISNLVYFCTSDQFRYDSFSNLAEVPLVILCMCTLRLTELVWIICFLFLIFLTKILELWPTTSLTHRLNSNQFNGIHRVKKPLNCLFVNSVCNELLWKLTYRKQKRFAKHYCNVINYALCTVLPGCVFSRHALAKKLKRKSILHEEQCRNGCFLYSCVCSTILVTT